MLHHLLSIRAVQQPTSGRNNHDALPVMSQGKKGIDRKLGPPALIAVLFFSGIRPKMGAVFFHGICRCRF